MKFKKFWNVVSTVLVMAVVLLAVLLVGVRLFGLQVYTVLSGSIPEIPTVQIDGYDYIGTLTIPALELELPVMAEWDYDRLLIAPCRQFGTTQTNDLVIAAHNYTRHFGLLYELSPGDAVIFTAPDGAGIDYVVAEVRTLAPDEVEAVQNSGHALTLYTCTSGGVARTAVFCDRASAGKK